MAPGRSFVDELVTQAEFLPDRSLRASGILVRAGSYEDPGALGEFREFSPRSCFGRHYPWRPGRTRFAVAHQVAEASRISPSVFDQWIHETRRKDWWGRHESRTDLARSVEELSRPGVRVVPLNETDEVSSPGGFALLGTIEDSLALELHAQDLERKARGLLSPTNA